MLNVISGILNGGAAPDLGAYEAISTITIGAGGASSITFSSIPQTYKHLQIRELSRNTRAALASNNFITFNGDTGANYSWHGIQANGSSVSAVAGSNANLMLSTSVSNSTTANVFSVAIYDILDYSNTSKYKTLRILDGGDTNGAGFVDLWSGSWRSTSAITSYSMYAQSGDYMQYSSFALYGIKG